MHNRLQAVHRLWPRYTARDLQQSPSAGSALLTSLAAICQGTISINCTLTNRRTVLGSKDATGAELM